MDLYLKLIINIINRNYKFLERNSGHQSFLEHQLQETPIPFFRVPTLGSTNSLFFREPTLGSTNSLVFSAPTLGSTNSLIFRAQTLGSTNSLIFT
jgi:hypothetical protein